MHGPRVGTYNNTSFNLLMTSTVLHLCQAGKGVDVRSEQLTVHLWKVSFLLPPHYAPLSLTDEFSDVDGLWSYVCLGHWMSAGDYHGERSRLCRKVYWRETRQVDRWELTGWTSAVVFHICCDFRYFIISSFIFHQLELLHANVAKEM